MSAPERILWPSAGEKERERREKREAVLRAAVRAFNEKGFHATSLDDVAHALNVTKPTIYHYFASKDDILFDWFRRGVDGIRAAAVAVEAHAGGGV